MWTLPNKYRNNQGGQALLVILLVMSLALTTVLSIVAKSVTDVGITKSQDNSIRAFNAAEAGIEKGLIGTFGYGNFSDSGATYTSESIEADAGSQFIYPKYLGAGESAVFWFAYHTVVSGEEKITCQGHSCANPLTLSHVDVCWGDQNTPSNRDTTPAVMIEFYYEPTTIAPLLWDSTPNNFSNIKVARSTADPYAARNPSSGFGPNSGGGCSITEGNFKFHKRVNFNSTGGNNSDNLELSSWSSYIPGSLIMIRVQMFFNTDTPRQIGLKATGGSLAPQGVLIQSTGTSGDTQRKLNFFQGYPEPPFVFDSTVFSGSDISK